MFSEKSIHSPKVDETLAQLTGVKVFSKLEIHKRLQQIKAVTPDITFGVATILAG